MIKTSKSITPKSRGFLACPPYDRPTDRLSLSVRICVGCHISQSEKRRIGQAKGRRRRRRRRRKRGLGEGKRRGGLQDHMGFPSYVHYSRSTSSSTSLEMQSKSPHCIINNNNKRVEGEKRLLFFFAVQSPFNQEIKSSLRSEPRMRDEQRGKKGRGSRSSEEGKEKVHKLTKEGSILVCPGSPLIEPEAPVPCV